MSDQQSDGKSDDDRCAGSEERIPEVLAAIRDKDAAFARPVVGSGEPRQAVEKIVHAVLLPARVHGVSSRPPK